MIALSAHALPAQVVAGLQAGFDRYLTKPVSPSALREAVLAAHDAHTGASEGLQQDSA